MKNIINTSLIFLGAFSSMYSANAFTLNSEDCKTLSPLYKKWLNMDLNTSCCSKESIECTLGEITEIDLKSEILKSVEFTVEDIEILKKLPKLQKLDLSENLFYGEIPAEINTLNINEIDLSNNYFSGNYPSIASSKNICLEENCLTIPSNVTVNNSFGCNNSDQKNISILKDGRLPPDVIETVGKISVALLCVLIIVPVVIIIICCICCCCCCKNGKKEFRPYKGKMNPDAAANATNAAYSTPAPAQYPPASPAAYPPPTYQTQYPPQSQYPPQTQYPPQAQYPPQTQASYPPAPSANEPSAPGVPPLNLAGDISENSMPNNGNNGNPIYPSV